MLYPIAILPGDDQHAWGVEVPDIPGCFSAGDDLDDAMTMAREAIEGHLEILAEEGASVPVASKGPSMQRIQLTLGAPGLLSIST